jgi:hypothetical protein
LHGKGLPKESEDDGLPSVCQQSLLPSPFAKVKWREALTIVEAPEHVSIGRRRPALPQAAADPERLQREGYQARP